MASTAESQSMQGMQMTVAAARTLSSIRGESCNGTLIYRIKDNACESEDQCDWCERSDCAKGLHDADQRYAGWLMALMLWQSITRGHADYQYEGKAVSQ